MAFSQCGKVFAFGSPGYNAVIEKYLGQGRVYLQPLTNNINNGDDHDHEPLSSVTWHASKVQYLDDAMKLLEEEEETRCGEMMIKRENEAAGSNSSSSSSSSSNSNSSNVGFWWDCSIENMDLEELKQLLVSLQKLKDKVEKKAGHIQIISKPSSSSSSFLSLTLQ